ARGAGGVPPRRRDPLRQRLVSLGRTHAWTPQARGRVRGPHRAGPDAVPTDPEPELKRGKRFLISYVGVMGPQDGVDHAIRALAVLKRRRTDWHATFMGNGEMLDEMR